MDIYKETRDFLLKMGIKPSTLGYTYLKTAIPMVFNDRSLLKAITTQLFPKIGEEFDAAPKNVDRDIRHSIKSAMNRVDYETLIKYFGEYPMTPDGSWVTVSVFLAVAVEHLDSIMKG